MIDVNKRIVETSHTNIKLIDTYFSQNN